MKTMEVAESSSNMLPRFQNGRSGKKIPAVARKLLNLLAEFFRRFLLIVHRTLLVRGQATSPFLSGDGLRRIADVLVESAADLDKIDRCSTNSIIFVASHVLVSAGEEFRKRAKQGLYIVHNGDTNIDVSAAYAIPDGSDVFAQNCEFDHPRFHPVPIGLENELVHFRHGITIDFRLLRMKSVSKKFRVLYGFNRDTNPQERDPALAVLKRTAVADHLWGWNSFVYRRILRSYAFVASPPGNGIDCHRTWEALYLHTIPIVKSSIMTKRFRDAGLPLWLVEDWHEIEFLTEKELRDIYESMNPDFDHEWLQLDYWRSTIKRLQLARETVSNDSLF